MNNASDTFLINIVANRKRFIIVIILTKRTHWHMKQITRLLNRIARIINDFNIRNLFLVQPSNDWSRVPLGHIESRSRLSIVTFTNLLNAIRNRNVAELTNHHNGKVESNFLFFKVIDDVIKVLLRNLKTDTFPHINHVIVWKEICFLRFCKSTEVRATNDIELLIRIVVRNCS